MESMSITSEREHGDVTETHQRAMANAASCLDPMRSKVVPSSKAFPIASSQFCPIVEPSSPDPT